MSSAQTCAVQGLSSKGSPNPDPRPRVDQVGHAIEQVVVAGRCGRDAMSDGTVERALHRRKRAQCVARHSQQASIRDTLIDDGGLQQFRGAERGGRERKV